MIRLNTTLSVAVNSSCHDGKYRTYIVVIALVNMATLFHLFTIVRYGWTPEFADGDAATVYGESEEEQDNRH